MVFRYNVLNIYKQGLYNNNRGIRSLSCTCKLFTVCLNTRLSFYINDIIFGWKQASLREEYSTIGQAVVLLLVIELQKSVSKCVFCVVLIITKPLIM